MSSLTVKLFENLTLKSPLLSASGCFGFGLEYQDYFNPNQLGAVVLKGLTLENRFGNHGERVCETPSGMLNSVGLENPGIDYFIQEIYPNIIKTIQSPLIANINGNTVEEYVKLAEKLEKMPKIQAIELNVSCPNVKHGGMSFGTSDSLVYTVTKAVKSVTSKPLIVKLTPNVTDIKAVAVAAEKGGADGFSLINTVLGMAIDVEKKQPVLGNIFGGLSGPAIKPIALRMVYQVREVTTLPIIGMGGIASAKDVLEFMMAGANAVSIGTMLLANPNIISEIEKDLKQYMREKNIASLHEILNAAHQCKRSEK